MADGIKDRLVRQREWFDDYRELLPAAEFKAKYSAWANSAGPALKRAGDYFGLDPSIQLDATVLLRVLAHAVFGEIKKGRKKGTNNWSSAKYLRLGGQFEELKKAHPSIRDNKAAEKICDSYRGEYASAELVRRRLPRARLLFHRTGGAPEKPNGGVKGLSVQGMVRRIEEEIELIRLSNDRYRTLLKTREGRKIWRRDHKDRVRLAQEMENLSTELEALEAAMRAKKPSADARKRANGKQKPHQFISKLEK